MQYDIIVKPALEPVIGVFYRFTYPESGFESLQGWDAVVSVTKERDKSNLATYFADPRIMFDFDGGSVDEELLSGTREVFECRSNKEHGTGLFWDALDVDVGDEVYRDEFLWPFDESVFQGDVSLAKTALLEQLKTRFRGLDYCRKVRGYRPIPPTEKGRFPDRGYFPDAMGDYSILYAQGKCTKRGRVFVSGAGACPHCGYTPLTCPGCGLIEFECPECEKRIWRGSGEEALPNDKRYRHCPISDQALSVFEGHTWDGSDFVSVSNASTYGFYVTKRVVDYLLSIHATSFKAIPVTIDAEKMSDQQRQWMDEARRMPN